MKLDSTKLLNQVIATPLNCGNLLRAHTTKRLVKARRGRGNDLGYGKNVWDWTIRSEAPSV